MAGTPANETAEFVGERDMGSIAHVLHRVHGMFIIAYVLYRVHMFIIAQVLHRVRDALKRIESAREWRIALYKSDRQQ